MTRSTVFLVFAFFVFALAPLRAGEQPGPRVWFVDSLIKIFPGDAVGSHRLIRPELPAARGQHVSVQLAVRSARALDGLTAEVGPFKDSAGATLAGTTVRLEGYVVVGSHTRHTPNEELVGEAPGWFPDPLLDFPVSLQPRRTQPLWIMRTAINNCECSLAIQDRAHNFLTVADPSAHPANSFSTVTMTLSRDAKYWSWRQSLRVSFQTRSMGFKSGL
jgi:hypothetical protein